MTRLGHQIHSAGRQLLVVLSVVLCSNLIFLSISIGGAIYFPKDAMQNVRQAFADGALVPLDIVKRDVVRGEFQTNDCLVLEMITSKSDSALRQAVGPVIYARWPDVCRSLEQISERRSYPLTLTPERYTRYWHGYVPVTSALLHVTDIPGARIILRCILAGAIGLLFCVGWSRRGAIGIFAMCVAGSASLFWALPYYGQSFSFAPGDIVVLLGLALMIMGRQSMQIPSVQIAYCAVYGASITYLEFLTGQIPTAAGLLFALTFLLAREERHVQLQSPWWRAISALVAFGLGCLGTLLMKALLILWVFGDAQLQDAIHQGQYYAGTGESLLPLYGQVVLKLLWNMKVLTYYSVPASKLLLVMLGVIWGTAILLPVLSRNWTRFEVATAHGVGALSVPLWMMIMPRHFEIHAPFMVRIVMIVPALGLSALISQLRASEEWKNTAQETVST